MRESDMVRCFTRRDMLALVATLAAAGCRQATQEATPQPQPTERTVTLAVSGMI